MSTELTSTRSRRAVLAAAAGAAAATVVSAIDRPTIVRAGSDGDVVPGAVNETTTTTTINVTGEFSDQTGLGVTGGPHGSIGRGRAYGVIGQCTDGGCGVVGTGSTGVSGMGSESGVYGSSGYGGTGVLAVSETSDGFALRALGRVGYRRSGRATVPAARSYVDADLRSTFGLAGSFGQPALCFANLMTYRAGTYVTTVRPNYPVKGKMRIYLNRAVAASTYVAWFVLN